MIVFFTFAKHSRFMQSDVKSEHFQSYAMTIKVNFLCNLLDLFSENLGDISDEQGEKFHHGHLSNGGTVLRKMIKMMSDYCWNLK